MSAASRLVGAPAVALPGADVEYVPDFLDPKAADRLLGRLRDEIAWSQHRVRVFGREHPCPRLSAWYGDAGATYRYSGQTLEPLVWTRALGDLRRRVEDHCGERFDGVLLNLYRDGRDGMGWHSDDERELGADPTIASVSLGAVRRFQLRHRTRKEVATETWPLAHGSLFVMRGTTQRHWRHAVPKTKRAVGARINLSFRRVLGPDGAADHSEETA